MISSVGHLVSTKVRWKLLRTTILVKENRLSDSVWRLIHVSTNERSSDIRCSTSSMTFYLAIIVIFMLGTDLYSE